MSCNAEFRIQNSDNVWSRLLLCLNFAFCILNYTAPAEAQIGQPVTEIAIEEEGRPVTEPAITALIETCVGTPLDAGQVRDIGQKFVSQEDVTIIVAPPTPLLVNVGSVANLLTPIGAIHPQVIGTTSAIKTSTGIEARFLVPVLNIPFRLIGAYNPQRFGVINNSIEQTPRFTFRFAVGTTF